MIIDSEQELNQILTKPLLFVFLEDLTNFK